MGITGIQLMMEAKRIWMEQIVPVQKEILATLPRSFRTIYEDQLSDEGLDMEVARTLGTATITEETKLFKTLYWELEPFERRFILTKLIREEVKKEK